MKVKLIHLLDMLGKEAELEQDRLPSEVNGIGIIRMFCKQIAESNMFPSTTGTLYTHSTHPCAS